MSIHLQSAGEIAGIAAAGVTILAGVAWVARQARWFHLRIRHFLDDWAGEPARPGVAGRPGVMESIADLRQQVAEVKAETRPNGGASLRDAVHRIEQDVAAVKGDVGPLAGRVELFEHEREDRDQP